MMHPSLDVQHVGDDESISTMVQLLRESSAERVAFVLPEVASPVRREADLQLLRHFADQAGKELILVTQDAVVAKICREAGITHYPSLEVMEAAAAGEKEPPEKHRKKSSPTWFRPRMAHLWILPLLVAAIGAAVIFTTPKARVVVSPAAERLVQPVEILIRPGEAPAEQDGVIDVVGASAVEGETVLALSVPASGKAREGIRSARGVVAIINDKGQEVKVPKGTVFSTASGEKFLTVEDVTVPGAKTEYYLDMPVGIRSGQAEVRVEAKEPGSAGNVAKGRIKVVEGRLAGVIKVGNPEAAAGGEDRVFTVVRPEDVAALQKKLAEGASAAALEYLRNMPESRGLVVLDQTLQHEVLSVSVKQNSGTEGDTVEGTALVKATAWVVKADVLSAAAGKVFQRAVSGDKVIMGDGVQISEIQVADTTEEGVRLRMNATGLLAPRIEKKQLQHALAGLSLEKAEDFLRRFSTLQSFRIENGSRRSLPGWEGWITVVVEQPYQ